jgi:hypothetical protein
VSKPEAIDWDEEAEEAAAAQTKLEGGGEGAIALTDALTHNAGNPPRTSRRVSFCVGRGASAVLGSARKTRPTRRGQPWVTAATMIRNRIGTRMPPFEAAVSSMMTAGSMAGAMPPAWAVPVKGSDEGEAERGCGSNTFHGLGSLAACDGSSIPESQQTVRVDPEFAREGRLRKTWAKCCRTASHRFATLRPLAWPLRARSLRNDRRCRPVDILNGIGSPGCLWISFRSRFSARSPAPYAEMRAHEVRPSRPFC